MKQIPKERNVNCVAHPKKASVDLTDTTWREEMAPVNLGLPWWLSGKEPTCQCRRCGFHSQVGKIPWRRKWQPTPVFLPGKSHGQRSLGDHSLWSRKRVRHNLGTEWQRTASITKTAWTTVSVVGRIVSYKIHIHKMSPYLEIVSL